MGCSDFQVLLSLSQKLLELLFVQLANLMNEAKTCMYQIRFPALKERYERFVAEYSDNNFSNHCHQIKDNNS